VIRGCLRGIKARDSPHSLSKANCIDDDVDSGAAVIPQLRSLPREILEKVSSAEAQKDRQPTQSKSPLFTVDTLRIEDGRDTA